MQLAARLPRRLALGLLVAYKRCLSPLLPPSCRYYPTCSDYAREAIERHGACKGSWLGFKRLLRCHPLRPGGVDPPP